jgi:hypothetical protein
MEEDITATWPKPGLGNRLGMYEQEKLGRWQGKKQNNARNFPSNSTDTFR